MPNKECDPRFKFLEEVELVLLHAILLPEPLSVVTTVLAFLSTAVASKLLKKFSVGQQGEIIKQLSQEKFVSEEAVETLLSALEQKVLELEQKKSDSKGGVSKVTALLQHMSKAQRDAMLQQLASKDPALTEQIRAQLFIFEDLVRLQAQDLKELFKHIAVAQWALALRKASPALKAKVSPFFSSRVLTQLQEEWASTPRLVADVEVAQQEILAKIMELDAQGLLIMDEKTV